MVLLSGNTINDLNDVADIELSIFEELGNSLKLSSLDFLIRVLIAIVVLIVGCYLIKIIRRYLKKILERSSIDPGNVQLLDQVIKILLYFVLALLILAHFGIQAASVIALLGSAGLTIGLAFQGALSNFAGGVLIISTKPFRLGDFIDIEGSFSGTVIEIGLIHTKLLTIDNGVVIIPNGKLANSTITNFTERKKRRVELVFGISYDQDIDKARDVIMSVVQADEDVIKDDIILIYVENIAPSSVDLGLKVYTANEKYLELKWRLNENIKKAMDANNIEIPYPQVDVHMR